MKRADLTNQIFGYWKVLEYDNSYNPGGHTRWICLCTACNLTIKSVAAQYLKSGRSKHCRCIKYRVDLNEQIFNTWKVIGYDNVTNSRIIECIKCGDIRKSRANVLLNRPETIFCNTCRNSNTKWSGNSVRYHSEYSAWNSMLHRCYSENDIRYYAYGGRGIVVCDEWKNDFNKFLNDMGLKPSEDYSMDRIDVNGNYCKENCRWASSWTQSRNKRDNVYETIHGMTLIRSDWYALMNASPTSIWRRINNQNMSFEEALFVNKLLPVMYRVDINNTNI